MHRSRAHATLEDVAREAGVSQTTVSYVLSNSKHAQRISQATKLRIAEAAERLGYSRNSIGAALQRGYTDLVVLMAVGWDLAIGHSAVTMAITRAAGAQGLATIVDVASDDSEALLFLRRVKSLNPYGLFLLWDTVSHPLQDLMRLQESGLPIVHLMPTGVSSIPTVTADRKAGTVMAVRRLVSLGHRKIGMLTHAESVKQTAIPKIEGYRQALQEVGIREEPELFEAVGPEFDDGYEGFRRLYGRRPDITAVISVGDPPALGAIAAAQDMGLRVPQEVSIVGHAGSPEGENFRPKLTTVAAPPKAVAQRATEMLMALRRGEAQPSSTLIPMEIIERGSTGPARRN